MEHVKISENMKKLPLQFNRRLIALVFCALILFSAFFLSPSRARAEDATDDDPAADLEIPCMIVVDVNDPTAVLYEKNADQRCIPGSTMKIMTCILSLELCDDLDQEVTVTTQASLLKDSNSLMGVIKGEQLTVRQLIYGLMLKSGNDAALLLAQTIGGDLEHFIELMNEKAAALGMEHTHFINPSGAYNRDQFSTPRDMAVLTCYAMKNDLFREIVSTVRYTIDPNDFRTRAMTMVNSNKLISDPEDSRLFYEFATGVKTGSTAQGGKCLVASASKGGAGVVAVLLGMTEGGSKLDRMSTVYEEAKYIMDLALTSQFVSYSAADLGLDGDLTLPVSGSDAESIVLRPSFSVETVLLSRKQAESIQTNPEQVECKTDVSFLTAPITEGDVCANATYLINGRELFSAGLVSTESVGASSAGLNISTVTTPAPVPEETPSENWFAPFYGWLFYLIFIFGVGVFGFLVFITIKLKVH